MGAVSSSVALWCRCSAKVDCSLGCAKCWRSGGAVGAASVKRKNEELRGMPKSACGGAGPLGWP